MLNINTVILPIAKKLIKMGPQMSNPYSMARKATRIHNGQNAKEEESDKTKNRVSAKKVLANHFHIM